MYGKKVTENEIFVSIRNIWTSIVSSPSGAKDTKRPPSYETCRTKVLDNYSLRQL